MSGKLRNEGCTLPRMSKNSNKTRPARDSSPPAPAKQEKPKLVTVHSARIHDQPAEGGREQIDEALRHEDERKRRKAA